MEFQEVINNRQSTRSFTDQEVTKEQLDSILDAAHGAPSAGNLQAYKIYVARDKDTKHKLAHIARDQTFIADAFLVLVFCADEQVSSSKYGDRGKTLYSIQDATIAACFAWLQAVDLGLAGAWVGAIDPDEVNVALGMGQGIKPVALMPIGYAGEKPTNNERINRVVYL